MNGPMRGNECTHTGVHSCSLGYRVGREVLLRAMSAAAAAIMSRASRLGCSQVVRGPYGDGHTPNAASQIVAF